MPKPTNTQELTARYLAAGAGFKPEEQFFALLNAASHLGQKYVSWATEFMNMQAVLGKFRDCFFDGQILEPLADDKAPF